MTPELQKRLESSLPPFDGRCIHNIDELNLSQLREMLAFAFASLEPHFPSVTLFHDWHEHDGFIVTAQDASWISLTAIIENERTLYESRDDDFAVRIAIYSPTFDWLLRYNIDSNDESDYNTASCDFDLSASPRIGSANILNECYMNLATMILPFELQSTRQLLIGSFDTISTQMTNPITIPRRVILTCLHRQESVPQIS